MKQPDFSERLVKLGAKVKAQQNAFGNEELQNALHRFVRAVDQFERVLDRSVNEEVAGWGELKALLKSPSVKKHFKGKLYKKCVEKLVGKTIKGSKKSEIEEALFKYVKKRGSAKPSVKKLKQELNDAMKLSGAKVSGKKSSLQKAFLNLGVQNIDEAVVELEKKFPEIEDLRLLAEANSIPYTERTTVSTLSRKILHYAKRAATNLNLVKE